MVRSVAIHPGATPFTRIRSFATSRASVFKAPTTPRRREFERTRLSIGWRTDIERIATTAPPPRSRIEGKQARTSRTVLWNVNSQPFVHWSSAKASKPPGGGPPAFGTRMSTPPNEPTALSTKAFTPSDRKSTRLNSSHGYISYAVFCLKKKKKKDNKTRK